MEYKKYKDITISRLGFGNMRLPEKDGRIDREKASAMIAVSQVRIMQIRLISAQ